jgi:hypothetical protein
MLRKRRGLIPAIQKAIEATFNKGDWIELGYKTGTEDFVSTHPRLLRSLDWGDSDYGGCVFEAIEYMLDRSDDENLAIILSFEKISNRLKKQNPDIFSELVDAEKTHQPVKTFKASESATEVLVRALKDAEILINTSGPPSAVDRMHTAFHAYLITACDDKKIGYVNNPNIIELFKALRENRPALQKLGNSDEEFKKNASVDERHSRCHRHIEKSGQRCSSKQQSAE